MKILKVSHFNKTYINFDINISYKLFKKLVSKHVYKCVTINLCSSCVNNFYCDHVLVAYAKDTNFKFS